ncbi:MAG: hypothetical protein KDC52_19890, partial [Ignavibacteriae bacterium]|nr:hypothetical protein [Ignavibacteriota bacterium]
MISKIIAICFIFCTFPLFAQQSINDTELKVQPCPKEISNLYKHVKLKHNEPLSLIAENEEEQKAADYFSHLIKEKFKSELQLNINKSDEKIFGKILFEKIQQDIYSSNDQYYEIHSNPAKKEILLRYKSQLGLLFAAVTLSEYFELNGSEIKLNYYDVKDYPDYYRRIISANPKPDEVFELLDYALKNKIESIAIASRQYPWFEVSEDYKNLFVKINEWKNKYGGPSIMQMHNIYEGKQIEISNPFDVNALKDVIKTGIENGADKLMILADDTPPFKYGEGYVLTSESHKTQFKHMADAHCFLMKEIKNWLKEKSLSTELYYVPPFYTYEDMHYGDMDLYKNTPWEEDAYKPFYRDLEYIGLNMPDEVFIMWCGPYVRSRTITMENLYDWRYNLKGKTPFLWDNTMYSHNPFISTPMFSAWENNLPVDFNNNTAG